MKRIPFVPAIYEHKARLIGVTPTALARNAELLTQAVRREVEVYAPDLLTVGVDVYNVEAEALGCAVRWFEDSNDVPAVVRPLFTEWAVMRSLKVPDPEREGRMPLHLDAAQHVAAEFGGERVVRGALTGPYSMACELYGAERFVMATIEEPERARELLAFCAQVTVAYGSAFLKRGAQPIVFDSRATPQLASPRVFRQMIAPLYRDFVMPGLKAAGAHHIPLIIGGNTTSVIEDLVNSGATQLLCDAPSDPAVFMARSVAAGVSFRVNVDARLVHSGPPEAVYARAKEILAICGDATGFLLGCGVVAYDTRPENVLAIRRAIDEFVGA